MNSLVGQIRNRIGEYCDILDFDVVFRSVGFFIDWYLLEFVEGVEAVDQMSDDCVLHVQIGLLGVCDKKLRAVHVGPFVGHRDDAAFVVLQVLIELVVKHRTPDAFAVLARVGRVARLNNETFKKNLFSIYIFCLPIN